MEHATGHTPLVPIRATCPVCGSDDVVYTCSPTCCFNHVCGACRASWQLGTEPAAGPLPAVAPPSGDYDTSHPTAPCARCRDLVWQLADRPELWCTGCRTLLHATSTEVRPFETGK